MIECRTKTAWNARWTVLSLLLAVHCSLLVSPASAQTFTQRLQQHKGNEGTVTLHQDKAIDLLVNGPAAAPAKTPAKNTATNNATKPAAKQPKTEKQEHNADKPSTAQQQEKDSTATTPRHTRKVTGYRVQAFAGRNTRDDRQKAMQTASAIRSLFPGEQVYTHFYNPRWVCHVGNYANYEEARAMLSELRKLGYSSATIVKTKITQNY